MVKKLFSYERMSRLMVSLLLCLGVLWPLMWALQIQAAFLPATLTAVVTVAVCTFSGLKRQARFLIGGAGLLVLVVQLFLPGMGLVGRMVEAVKAFALYLNGFSCAASLYRMPLALTLALASAVVSYLFSHKGAGFIPATVLLVLVLFGLWSLGKHNFFWFAAPGLVALLMIISQSSHEKINLFEVLPMAAVLVVLAMLITPAGKTVIEPLHKAAMQLKETIADYLFFTEPRNVFTLGSYGYYPMGQSKLGGPAEPGDYPVMLVETDRRALLRGVVKDHYTGRNWQDTSSGRRLLYVHPGWRSQRVAAFLENMPDDTVRNASDLLGESTLRVEMSNNAASTLFSPLFLRNVAAEGSLVPYFNEGSELFVTRDLEAGDRYSVTAPLLEGGDAALGALVKAAAGRPDPYYMGIYARYTQLPGHLEETLYYDLQNIVAGADTPYEQACAIQRHLKRYYRYTLTPEYPPENQDFVTYFLYVGKEGYCTYFASAMTVLCRMAGLPARYAEGFIAEPDEGGMAYVTGLNAHAWTEVYFEGFGWVPFDATPSRQNQDQSEDDPPPPPDEPEPTPTPTPTPSPTPSPTPTHDPDSDEPTPTPTPPHEAETPEPPVITPPPEIPPKDRNFSWLWWLLLLAAAAALAARILLRMPEKVASRQPAVADRLFVYGNAVAQMLRMRGQKVQPGETPMLFARRMDKTKAAGVAITPLWRSMTLCNYSRRTPTQVLADQARDIFRAVYRPQPFLVKVRFALSAALNPGFYRMLTTQVDHQEPKPLFIPPAGPEQKKKKEQDTSLFQPGEAERRRMEQQNLEIERAVAELLAQMDSEQDAARPRQEQPRRTRRKRAEEGGSEASPAAGTAAGSHADAAPEAAAEAHPRQEEAPAPDSGRSRRRRRQE